MARELNLSETVFVFPPDHSAHTRLLVAWPRIFGFDDIRRSVAERRMQTAGIVVDDPTVEGCEQGAGTAINGCEAPDSDGHRRPVRPYRHQHAVAKAHNEALIARFEHARTAGRPTVRPCATVVVMG